MNGGTLYNGGTNDVGGAIKLTGNASAKLTGVLISDCWSDKARTYQNEGGAIYMSGSATAELKDCAIRNCHAGDYGGAVYIEDEGNRLTCDNVTILNCKADDNYGGGVYQDEGETNWIGGTIANCSAGEYGGGFYQRYGKVYMQNVSFEENSTTYDGGAFYLDAGGRESDNVTSNVYSAKKYVAAVFCGVGSTPEEAIGNLYGNAASSWAALAAGHKDISATPLVTEFDEIIPVDLSSEHPWYELYCGDTSVKSLKNGEWVYGNEMAHYRWEGYSREDAKPVDEYEKSFNCAYIGVVRTDDKAGAAYGLLKYYTGAAKAPSTLSTGGTKCYLAGGPVKSKEGSYFLYYSPNTGTASYQAPITGLHISDEMFINGYNTSFTVSESDRVNNELPKYGQLRMRTDEYKYIHLGYERAELPYYEQLYLGVGNTKEEAYADMVGTTNAYGAMDVDCNYNSFSKKWIAIGYRRTADKSSAIRDVFLYSGDNPPEQIRIAGGYTAKQEKEKVNGRYVKQWVFYDYADAKGEGVP